MKKMDVLQIALIFGMGAQIRKIIRKIQKIQSSPIANTENYDILKILPFRKYEK